MSIRAGVHARVNPILGWAGVFLICVAVAGALSGTIRPPAPFNLPPELVVLALLFAIGAPLLLTRWRTTFWVLLGWFMVEDLIRKYLGNDIRVYFMKDVVFVLLFAGMLLDASARGMWARISGSSRLWLYGLIAWTLVLTVPMFMVDWRIPLIALKLDWEYVPLVVAGYLLATEHDGLRWLLTGFVALGIPACLIGVVQAYIGPSFLRPEAATPFLFLDLTRKYDVFQPTSTFADPGRFGSVALLVFVASLALLVLTYRTSRTRFRLFALAGVVSASAAVWANASKTGVIIALALSGLAALAPGFAERRPAFLRAALTVGLVVGTLGIMFALFPKLSGNRVSYFRDTLDPSSTSNEWDFRYNAWIDNASRGIHIGGLIGAGTGAGSNGLQYLGGTLDFQQVTGIEQIEGGYASVAQQWGLVGIVLWLGWTLSWVGREATAVRRSRGSPVAGVGLLLLAWTIYYLFIGFVGGFQSFQNYYANAYLWIFSGMIFALPQLAQSDTPSTASDLQGRGQSSPREI